MCLLKVMVPDGILELLFYDWLVRFTFSFLRGVTRTQASLLEIFVELLTHNVHTPLKKSMGLL